MMLARKVIAIATVVIFCCSGAVALANGTDTTYPSQCVADDHPRGCWGNVRISEVIQNLGANGKTLWQACPNATAEEFLQASLVDASKRMSQHSAKRLFQAPQGLATLVSIVHYDLANEAMSCSAFQQSAATFFQVSAIYHLQLAVWYARIAGNSQDFSTYVRKFRSELNKALDDSTLSRWPREYVLYQKRLYCAWMVPENGPEYPDYGRLYTWDDFHADRCEQFNYY